MSKLQPITSVPNVLMGANDWMREDGVSTNLHISIDEDWDDINAIKDYIFSNTNKIIVDPDNSNANINGISIRLGFPLTNLDNKKIKIKIRIGGTDTLFSF